jgi:hypothetical protein
MKALQNFVQKNLFTLLLLLIAGGFVMLLVELILMGHTDGTQLVAVIACAAGLILASAGLFAKSKMRHLLAVLFLLLSVSGLYGTLEHTEKRQERVAETTGITVTANGTDEGNALGQELVGEFQTFPPALSPLGLSGFSALGAVALLGKKDEKWQS